jgi:hypothetical protein
MPSFNPNYFRQNHISRRIQSVLHSYKKLDYPSICSIAREIGVTPDKVENMLNLMCEMNVIRTKIAPKQLTLREYFGIKKHGN